jgi:hypothetical protein
MDMTLKIAVFVGVKNPQQKMPELVRLLGQVELTRSGDDIPNISPQFVGEIRIETSPSQKIRQRRLFRRRSQWSDSVLAARMEHSFISTFAK